MNVVKFTFLNEGLENKFYQVYDYENKLNKWQKEDVFNGLNEIVSSK